MKADIVVFMVDLEVIADVIVIDITKKKVKEICRIRMFSENLNFVWALPVMFYILNLENLPNDSLIGSN